MATPSETIERERLRQEGASLLQAQRDTSLDLDKTIAAVLSFRVNQGVTAERRSATAMKEVSDLEQLRAKLSADAFSKALGTLGPLLTKAMSAGVTPKDQQDLVIKLKELQLASTKALSQVDNAAIQRYQTAATAVAGQTADRATYIAEVYKQATADLIANGVYNPSLTGTVKAIKAMGPVPAELTTQWAAVEDLANERTNLLADINAFGSTIPNDIGSMQSASQVAEAQKFLKALPADSLNTYAAKLSRLPNAGSLDQPIADKQTEAISAKDRVNEFLKMDPMSVITELRGGSSEVKAQVSERLRVLSSEKFQKWAASNGLRVGSVRPATSEADKNLPGYIPSTNSVYVAGAEDDRALGIATKQATMKPSQMLIPRRGLETRKYVEATVGGTAQPGPTGFTKVAFDDKAQKAVFIRADGSAVAEDGGSYDTELAAKLTSQPLAGEQLQKVNDDMAKTLTTTGGGQKIRGVETALMWSDPPDAIMAVETPEGKRVIIRKQDEKTINVLSGGKERKDGVVRSLLAKSRERIARPGEDKLRAADEAAMSEVDKAREAELETKRQANQAANSDRMQPAAAKAAVEAALEEAPTPRKEAPETMTRGDIGRAKLLVGLGEKAGSDIKLQQLARRARGAEAYTTSDPNLYRSTMLQLGQEAEDFLRNKRIPPRDLSVAGTPEVQVTPASEAGKEVREASSVNITGGNAPQMLGVATGTPASAPAVPAQNDEQRRIAALRDVRLKRQQDEREMSTLGSGTTR